MDEPTEPAPGSGRRPAVAAGVHLSPLQQAWERYVDHSLHCRTCQNIDQRCSVAPGLFRAWRALAGKAARIVAGE